MAWSIGPCHHKTQESVVENAMTVQTLVVTTNQLNNDIVEKMNLKTDTIIGNQCGVDRMEEFIHNGSKIQMLSLSTKGVGKNRNEVLMRANADVCVLADDDMCFFDNYEDLVVTWFERLPQADILIFNLEEAKPRRHKFEEVQRINWLNYRKYGAARIAFRLRPILLNGIMFNMMFGGGCPYSCGEDTLFLDTCLRKGLKIYGVPATLASITDGNSTWFQGYNDKYFFDRGVLYYIQNKRLCKFQAVYHCVKYRKKYSQYGVKKAIKQIMKGIQSISNE